MRIWIAILVAAVAFETPLAYSSLLMTPADRLQRCADLLVEGTDTFSVLRVEKGRVDHPFIRDLDTFVLLDVQADSKSAEVLVRAIARNKLNSSDKTPVEVVGKSINVVSLKPYQLRQCDDLEELGSIKLMKCESGLKLYGFRRRDQTYAG